MIFSFPHLLPQRLPLGSKVLKPSKTEQSFSLPPTANTNSFQSLSLALSLLAPLARLSRHQQQNIPKTNLIARRRETPSNWKSKAYQPSPSPSPPLPSRSLSTVSPSLASPDYCPLVRGQIQSKDCLAFDQSKRLPLTRKRLLAGLCYYLRCVPGNVNRKQFFIQKLDTPNVMPQPLKIKNLMKYSGIYTMCWNVILQIN
jgi:hypothetical protein